MKIVVNSLFIEFFFPQNLPNLSDSFETCFHLQQPGYFYNFEEQLSFSKIMHCGGQERYHSM